MDSNPPDSARQDLRRSLERLLQTDFLALQEDIRHIQAQLQALEGLAQPLPEGVEALRASLQALLEKSARLERDIAGLQQNLNDPLQAAGIVRRGLESALDEEIHSQTERYSQIIAPVISPAISNQIRNARPEMVAALYPIIGQTISKAISEAMQDLRRRIDANLKRSFDVRQSLRHFAARLKGVSSADLILRESLDYRVAHVFHIHRETGLLLQHLSSSDEAQDMDIFSAMLTAIRDFARDTFGSQEEDLEEIQHGALRILLKNGLHSYLAVVVEGVQPPGYAGLMQQAVHQINLDHRDELRGFNGDMQTIPDCRPALLPLLNPSPADLGAAEERNALSSGQKKLVAWGAAALVLLAALAVFACIFSVRLLPVAFPAPSLTPTHTASPTLTPRPSATPTPTCTASPTLTPLPSATPAPSFTPPGPAAGIMTGNVWVRREPRPDAGLLPAAIRVNTRVQVLAVFETWSNIAWQDETGAHQGWVPSEWVELISPVPGEWLTPGA